MYGNPIQILNKELVKKGLIASDIYSYFINFEVGIPINSPFPNRMKDGHTDSTPSLFITEWNGELRWWDFGLLRDDSKVMNDAIGFVQLLFNLRSREDAAIKIINRITNSDPIKTKFRVSKSKSKSYKTVTPKLNYDEYELSYWDNLGFTEEELINEDVFALDNYSYNGNVQWISTRAEPKYLYKFTDDAWQVYNPLGKKTERFKTHNINKVLIDWDKLPKTAPFLFISKSKKDVMIWKKMGVKAVIAPLNEVALTNLLIKKDEINSRFNRSLILFDGDKTGNDSADFLAQTTGWDALHLPYPPNTKDPGDIIKEYGCTEGYKLLKTIFYGVYK